MLFGLKNDHARPVIYQSSFDLRYLSNGSQYQSLPEVVSDAQRQPSCMNCMESCQSIKKLSKFSSRLMAEEKCTLLGVDMLGFGWPCQVGSCQPHATGHLFYRLLSVCSCLKYKKKEATAVCDSQSAV